MIEVVAAMIFQGDRFLICQRPETKARALKWEFPGGKLEPGESGPEALIRECREELGCTVSPLLPLTRVEYAYPDVTIGLTLYKCTLKEGPVMKLEHNDLRWIKENELPEYDFCPADREMLKNLSLI